MLKPVLLVVLVVVWVLGAAVVAQDDHSRWEETISKFEAKDAEAAPPEGAVLFIGSSSIVGWDLDKWFPTLETTNRGFGGSQIGDSTHYADRIAIPYKPRAVVLYAGDNDIASGKSPERVAADFLLFVEKIREGVPGVPILFVAIKPSLSRWEMIEDMRKANDLVKAIMQVEDDMVFVDIDTPMIGDDDRPKPELFKDDGLHLNETGYELWTSVLLPLLPDHPDSVVTTDSGLKYVELEVGEGASPKKGDTIAALYTGRLMDGTIFDASDRHGGEPIEFPLGMGRVIEGWDEGLMSMKVGGKRKLIIPCELAYGDDAGRGHPLGGQTLVFEVELVDVKE